jgi:hypothetical protein
LLSRMLFYFVQEFYKLSLNALSMQRLPKC